MDKQLKWVLGRLLLHFMYRKHIIQKFIEDGEEKRKTLEVIQNVLDKLIFKFAKSIYPELEVPPDLMESNEPIEDPVMLQNLDKLTKQVLESDPKTEFDWINTP